MTQTIMMLLATLILITQSAWSCEVPTEERAMERAQAYAEAIDHDYKHPEKIYALLEESFRDQMDEKSFCDAFAKERSYPYITPLYISKPHLTLDGNIVHVVYDQAARLSGMTYKIDLIFENGDWFVRDWEEFLDGSYLEKFENIPYSLDWYYDTQKIE
ncbi:MAG TPA: hypothetical protein PKW50_04155 [Syntrophomonas sp.]|nr:hypothetical protein [Syntrophomonas sp.]